MATKKKKTLRTMKLASKVTHGFTRALIEAGGLTASALVDAEGSGCNGASRRESPCS